jgi:hypothetical protein
VVPDFNKDGKKPDHSQAWIDSMMLAAGARAELLSYNYYIKQNVKSVWHQLQAHGDDLLRDLCDGLEKYQVCFEGFAHGTIH